MERKILVFIFCFILLAGFCLITPVYAQETTVPKMDMGDAGDALKDFSQRKEGDKDLILATTGIPQASDFDIGKMVACAIFGGIGFIAFMYGKKNAFWRPTVIGIVLMVYPYFLSATLAVYLVGILLVVALYFWRE